MKKILSTLLASLLLLAGLTSCAGANDRTKLTIAYQDTAFPALLAASGVLDGAGFDVEWANLTGPASNLQALYSGAVDLGHMGDTSLTIEQANSRKEWTADNAPLKIVAGWRSPYDPQHSPVVTAVRTTSGIDRIEQAEGHTWAFNFGGYNHAHYLLSLAKAGVTEQDIKPTQFADGASAAAAFNSGQTDVYSGSQGAILSSLASGEAKLLLTERDTGIPALNVWTASRTVLLDQDKDAALRDFFGRVSRYWEWHDANPVAVKDILKRELKVDDARADFEYRIRGGAFRAFDAPLIAQEQDVAQALYDGKAIGKLPDVGFEYDPRYNDVQGARSEAEANR